MNRQPVHLVAQAHAHIIADVRSRRPPRNLGCAAEPLLIKVNALTRDDLFTTIHKALRKGLFDVTVRAGATDWTHALVEFCSDELKLVHSGSTFEPSAMKSEPVNLAGASGPIGGCIIFVVAPRHADRA